MNVPPPSLNDQLIGGQQGQAMPVAQKPMSLTDHLTPLVQTPLDDFIVTLMEITDQRGELDAAFLPPTPEEQMDNASPDLLQDITKEEMGVLLDKFSKIDPPTQKMLLDEIKKADPRAYQRVLAAFRYTQRGVPGSTG